MKFNTFASATLVASLSLAPLPQFASPARADGKDVVAGLIIGGIIGSAVTNENNKKKKKVYTSGKKKTKSTKAKSPSMSSEQRAANIEVQNALNHFGWTVGGADGSLGPKSRSAITEYQGFMGYPATGELSDHQRSVLVTSLHRSEAGGSAISEIVSGSVYGLRGVLIAQEAEMAGGSTMAAGAIIPEGQPKPGSVAAAAAAALPDLLPEAAEVPVPQSPAIAAPAAIIAPSATPVIEAAAEVPAEAPALVAPLAVAAATDEPALPSFMDPNGAKGSLIQECNSVSMMTATNGGYTTAANMVDAGFALSEQFCLVRGDAVAQGQALAAKVAGFSPDQIAAQCAALAPALAAHVSALSLKPQDQVLAGMESFVLTSGMSPAQLSGTAKVCLGVGYGEDRMDVAIGSALLLTTLGEKAYAELLGHHLSQGFGATQRPDLAEAWYETAAEAMGAGAPVFVKGLAGRDALILKAAHTLNGRVSLEAPEAVVQEAALPSFTITPETEEAPAPAAVVELAPAPQELSAPQAVATPVVEEPATQPGILVDAGPKTGPDTEALTIKIGASIAGAALGMPILTLLSN